MATPPYGFSALWLLRLMASPPYGCFISAIRQNFRAGLQPTSVCGTDSHYTLGVDNSGPGFPPALCPVRLHSQVSMPGEPDRRYAQARASTQNTLRYGSVRKHHENWYGDEDVHASMSLSGLMGSDVTRTDRLNLPTWCTLHIKRIPITLPKRQLVNSFKLLCRYTVGRLQLLPMTSLASLASVVMPCAGPLLLVLNSCKTRILQTRKS